MALVGIQTSLLLDFTLKLRGCIDHKRELTAVENDRLVVHRLRTMSMTKRR